MEQQFVTKSGGIARFYERIARFAFLAMVALVPLTFIPWTVDGLEINKQTLVLACTAIAVIAWLGMMVVRKKFFFKKSVLFIVPMLLIVSVGVSSLLSLAPYTSWLGQGTQEYLSFFSVMAFVLIFVVGAHFLSETSVQKWVWWLSTLVSSVVGINILFGMFGFPIFTTNFIGTPNALGIYLLVMMVVGCSLLLVDGNTSASKISMDGAMGLVQKISIFVTSFSAIVVLLSIDYWVLWIAALIGVGTVFTFALVRAQEFPQTSRFILPMILFVISLLFLFLPSFLSGIFSVEVAPSFSSSFQVAQQSISDSSLMFGS
ncbi:hypothetical protein KJ766_00935, partial [Patescibacteria group bacterium]|nr:hypothetical protein [Patescibacteria group bacterium]